jgi:hypothetical protein
MPDDYNPWWHADVSNIRIIRQTLDVWGEYDLDEGAIYLSRSLTYAESRATLAHELVHHSFRDAARDYPDAWFACRHERTVHRLAAQRLITIPRLTDALRISSIPEEIADDLSVDEYSLWTRCTTLSDYERSALGDIHIDWGASQVLDLATLAA